MRVLLVGAKGQLGQHLNPLFPNLMGLDRKHLELPDSAAVTEIFRTFRPEAVINAAAYTGVDLAEQEPDQAFAVNCEGPGQLARECQRWGVPLVHFSTDYVFAGEGFASWSEAEGCAPVNQYGASKLAGEAEVRRHCERHYIVRTSWLFGARGHNFARTILRLAGEHESLRVVCDQRGCPTWCGHLAAVVRRMLESQQWGTYHYCDGPATSWWEFACEILEEARRLRWPLKAREVIAVTTAEWPTRARRPVCSVLDCSKLEQALGIGQADWREGLRKTLEELRLRPD